MVKLFFFQELPCTSVGWVLWRLKQMMINYIALQTVGGYLFMTRLRGNFGRPKITEVGFCYIPSKIGHNKNPK